MGIVLSQSDYVRKILPIAIDSNRRSQVEEKVNENERQQLRALIGSLQYASVNTRPDLASPTELFAISSESGQGWHID